MYLFCANPHLFSWTLLTQGRAESPFAVVRDGTILDACPESIRRGLQPEMTQKQAKAMVDGLRLIPWDPDPYEQASRTWCNTFLPYTNDLMRLDQHEIIIPLHTHPNPRAIAEKIMSSDKSGSVFGLGNSMWTARINAVDDLPSRHVSELVCLESSIRERLMILGCKTFADVIELSEHAIIEQFGKLAPRIVAACAGQDIDPYRANYPNNQISRCQHFESGISNELTLQMSIHSLCQQAAYELNQRSMTCAKLTIYLENEESDIFFASRDLKKELTGAQALSQAFNELALSCPFDLVFSIRLNFSELQAATIKQTELYLGKRTAYDVHRLERAIDTLRHNLGSESITVGSEVKIERRVKLSKYWERVLGLQP